MIDKRHECKSFESSLLNLALFFLGVFNFQTDEICFSEKLVKNFKINLKNNYYKLDFDEF